MRILKTLEEFLQSRTVKDDVFDNYVQLLQEELPPGSPPALKHEMGLDLLTSLLFAGHDTTAATMVFSVKYIGENPKVLAELRVSSVPGIGFRKLICLKDVKRVEGNLLPLFQQFPTSFILRFRSVCLNFNSRGSTKNF